MKKLGLILLLTILFSSGGCALFRTPKDHIIVISGDRYQYPLTNEVGIAGWFVPNAAMIDYQEALVKLKYYIDKETETTDPK